MDKLKPILAAIFGLGLALGLALFAGTAMAAHTADGLGNHTRGFTDHPAYIESDAGRSVAGPISSRDRALQRLDDIKRQTSDAYISSVGPDGFEPVPGTRIR